MNNLMSMEQTLSDRQGLWISLAAALHDLRNPLHNATLLVESIGSDGSDPLRIRAQALEQLDRIHGRMRRVMAHLSEYADDEVRQPVRLNNLVKEVVSLVAMQAHEVGASMSMDCPPHLVVEADPGFLSQALEHLVLNCLEMLALQAADRPRRLWISAYREDGAIHLSLRDSGPGLPPDRLFTPFEPLAGARRGMGMGLAIAHALARVGGGELVLHCSNASGTHFRIQLEEATP